MRKSTKKTKDPFVFEVTESAYRRKLAKKLDPETVLNPGRYRFQRSTHVVQPDEPIMVNGKVRVTVYLDEDVAEFLHTAGTSYQTEINAALRSLVERAKWEQELLSDAVVEKLANKVAQSLKGRAGSQRSKKQSLTAWVSSSPVT